MERMASLVGSRAAFGFAPLHRSLLTIEASEKAAASFDWPGGDNVNDHSCEVLEKATNRVPSVSLAALEEGSIGAETGYLIGACPSH